MIYVKDTLDETVLLAVRWEQRRKARALWNKLRANGHAGAVIQYTGADARRHYAEVSQSTSRKAKPSEFFKI